MSFWDEFPAYVSVAERRAQAAREVAKLRKKRVFSEAEDNGPGLWRGRRGAARQGIGAGPANRG